MTTDTLFALPSGEPAPPLAPPAAARVLRADRAQVLLRAVDLESLLPPDHRARVVMGVVEGLDLSDFYGEIRAVEGQAGRPAIDPAILVGLWVYATLEGVGSARAVARLCEVHDAYRWLCGGVGVSHQTLAEFRVTRASQVDALLTRTVAMLLSSGVAELTRVAHDGVRVRASAGSGSFRRKGRLREFVETAAAQVAALKAAVEADPGGPTRQELAAAQRAKERYATRVRRALAELPKVEAVRRKKGKRAEEARASTTDPEARMMRMPDQGFRPAYNVQLATTVTQQLIVGVAVSNNGSDGGQLAPMVAQVEARFHAGRLEWLADGGYATHADVEAASAGGGVVYIPVPRPRTAARGPAMPRPTDSEAVRAWRERMGGVEGQTIYKQRARTAEGVNAWMRNRGLRQLGVRGLDRVRAVVGWFALAHNVMRTATLRGAPRPA
jgi:transposase